jgi:hypothetical protein
MLNVSLDDLITNPNGHAILKWRLFIEASFGLNVFSVCNFGQFGFSKGNYLLFLIALSSALFLSRSLLNDLSTDKLEKY